MKQRSFSFQAAEVAARNQALINADMQRYAASARAVTSFVPTIIPRFGGTAPTYTATATSTYIITNNILFYWWSIIFAGVSTAGTATSWGITTPVALATTNYGGLTVGTWVGYDNSTTNTVIGYSAAGNGEAAITLFYTATSPVGVLTGPNATTPWTWAVNDVLSGFLQVRVPDGFNP